MLSRRLDVEPAAGQWQVATVEELLRRLLASSGSPSSRPAVVAVDGRSAGGKTTLAGRLSGAVPASRVVHTDDVAWHHSFLDWADLLAGGVLQPLRRGHEVRYRPPAWEARSRSGAIEVPAGLDLVVVEGVGAGWRELAHLVDVVVWVQSDCVVAEQRGIARDLALGGHDDAEQVAVFWRQWMAEEVPFLERQRPWERACVVVAGTPPIAHDPAHLLVAWPATPSPDR
jgi:uridine kinase